MGLLLLSWDGSSAVVEALKLLKSLQAMDVNQPSVHLSDTRETSFCGCRHVAGLRMAAAATVDLPQQIASWFVRCSSWRHRSMRPLTRHTVLVRVRHVSGDVGSLQNMMGREQYCVQLWGVSSKAHILWCKTDRI